MVSSRGTVSRGGRFLYKISREILVPAGGLPVVAGSRTTIPVGSRGG